MDSFPVHIVSAHGDDEFTNVHAAGLGVYALHEVTRVAFAGLIGAIVGSSDRVGATSNAQLSLFVDEYERQRGSCKIQVEVRQ